MKKYVIKPATIAFVIILSYSFFIQEKAYNNYYTSIQVWKSPFIYKVPFTEANWSENKFIWQESDKYFWVRAGELVNGKKLFYKKLKITEKKILDEVIKTSYRCIGNDPEMMHTSFVKWEYKNSNKFIIEIYDQIPNTDDIFIVAHSNFVPK